MFWGLGGNRLLWNIDVVILIRLGCFLVLIIMCLVLNMVDIVVLGLFFVFSVRIWLLVVGMFLVCLYIS